MTVTLSKIKYWKQAYKYQHFHKVFTVEFPLFVAEMNVVILRTVVSLSSGCLYTCFAVDIHVFQAPKF